MGLAISAPPAQQAIEQPMGVKAVRSHHAHRRRARPRNGSATVGPRRRKNQIKAFARAHIVIAGTDTRLVVPRFTLAGAALRRQAPPSQAKMRAAFERVHRARFGFIDRSKELVVEAVSVEAVGGGARFRERTHKMTRARLPAPARRTRFFSDGAGTAPACSHATGQAGPSRARPRHHHRAASDHRGRARLAGRAHRA